LPEPADQIPLVGEVLFTFANMALRHLQFGFAGSQAEPSFRSEIRTCAFMPGLRRVAARSG
jgi:hypothetical protein